jgi:rubrerythrin
MVDRIKDLKGITKLLVTAYSIETTMEKTSQWDAYVRISNKCRDTLTELSNDCVGHARTLRELAGNLKGFDIDAAVKTARPFELNMRGLRDTDIFEALIKVEKKALDIYTKLHDTADPDVIRANWSGTSSYMDFFVRIMSIMNDEKRHVKIVTDGACLGEK